MSINMKKMKRIKKEKNINKEWQQMWTCTCILISSILKLIGRNNRSLCINHITIDSIHSEELGQFRHIYMMNEIKSRMINIKSNHFHKRTMDGKHYFQVLLFVLIKFVVSNLQFYNIQNSRTIILQTIAMSLFVIECSITNSKAESTMILQIAEIHFLLLERILIQNNKLSFEWVL